jgi:hypothetical protein
MWQVIEQVSSLELGGSRNSVRYRTMANAGGIILRWLATHARQLTNAAVTILDENVLRDTTAASKSRYPLQSPTDRDLVDACEQWLAVTGTPEDRVEEMAQANEGPSNQTTGPIRIPQAARDLLDSVGIPADGVPGMTAASGYGGRFATRSA